MTHKKFLLGIAERYSVVVRFRPVSKSFAGWYNLVTKEITVHYSGDLATDVSTLLHEIGHAHCDREGIWRRFHNPAATPEDLLRYSYRAERYVDEWAEAEFNLLFPGGLNGSGFVAAYRTEESKAQLRTRLLKYAEKVACKING